MTEISKEQKVRETGTQMKRDALKPVYDYLYGVRDAKKNVWNLQKRIQLHEEACDFEGDSYGDYEPRDPGDPLITLYAELGAAELDAAYRKRDVADMICRLPGVNEQSILIRRYIDQMDWDTMAFEMKMSKHTIKKIHGEVLPRLQKILMDAGEITEEVYR